jgi:ferredoxin--NADP+ reductase
MSEVGTTSTPLRVAIIGSGPAGFYTAEHLLRQTELTVEIDIFDRLPTPFGLVRAGVAPDHQKIKAVTKVFERIANRPNVRFYGLVEFGTKITLADLQTHYHQICFTSGAQTDRRLNIPGEDLSGSHAATEFVAWYNGHPDFRDCTFDLSQEQVAVIGVGNVAVDVARILCRTPEELATTDIADHALEALRESKVKEVYLIGRRGPAQAAFTTPEIKEMGELAGADVLVHPDEATLDSLSQAYLAANPDRATQQKVAILQDYAQRQPSGKPRRLNIRFLASPVEILGEAAGRVTGVRLVKNELYTAENGSLRPQATDEFETLPIGLIFRSVGYRGVPLPDIPFHHAWGIIPNEAGRILNPDTDAPLTSLYTAGWIKRGPSGVIGTNKADAAQTVDCMLADLQNGTIGKPTQPEVTAMTTLIQQRQPNFISFADWHRLDELETSAGQAQGRPRIKMTRIDEMLTALGRK